MLMILFCIRCRWFVVFLESIKVGIELYVLRIVSDEKHCDDLGGFVPLL
jgi:hypothetical protein